MLVIPALDLLDGKCVRLRQGNYDESTEYSEDPAAMAKHWQDTGAEWLHVVDLNGARAGAPQHLDLVAALRQSAPGLKLEFGGGLRTMEAIERALEVVDRAVLGTAAVKDPRLVSDALSRFGERIAVGIDAREGLVATDGWESTSARPAFDLAQDMQAAGVKTIIFTDIERDGTLAGPNLSALGAIRGIAGIRATQAVGAAAAADARCRSRDIRSSSRPARSPRAGLRR